MKSLKILYFYLRSFKAKCFNNIYLVHDHSLYKTHKLQPQGLFNTENIPVMLL